MVVQHSDHGKCTLALGTPKLPEDLAMFSISLTGPHLPPFSATSFTAWWGEVLGGSLICYHLAVLKASASDPNWNLFLASPTPISTTGKSSTVFLRFLRENISWGFSG